MLPTPLQMHPALQQLFIMAKVSLAEYTKGKSGSMTRW